MAYQEDVADPGTSGVRQIETACPGGWRTPRGAPSLCAWVGLGLGILAAAVGEGVGLLPITGHQINDPVMLALSLNGLLKGFRYFNWVALGLAVSFPLAMGAVAWIGLRFFAHRLGRRVTAEDAVRAARASTLIGVLPVWIQEVAGVQVLIFYGLATWISLWVATLVARNLNRV